MTKTYLLHGDCIEKMGEIADNVIDAVVTDPPYHLSSIVKRFGKPDSAPAKSNGATVVYRRASTGFMGKEWDGGDIAFRPETWAEVLRVLKPGGHLVAFNHSRTWHRMTCAIEDAGFEIRDSVMWIYGSGFPKSHNVGKKLDEWQGWGTALKPAFEPIVIARKPLIGTVAANVLEHGVGAINIDGCRVETNDVVMNHGRKPTENGWDPRMSGGQEVGQTEGQKLGRWPANIIHDGSDEVLEAFAKYADAARFFYCAKASKKDRAGSKHPTVKPVALIQYLCRLVTPPGGIILDPFAGSGTTGEACRLEGFDSLLIEREDEYVADIKCRLGL